MKDEPEVIVYTDGACIGNPGPGGWAAILRHPISGKERKLSDGHPNTTNNRMELSAVINGLQALSTDKTWRVRVITDSQYVIGGMTEWIEGWIKNGWRRGKRAGSPPVKNADLWKSLHKVCGLHEVTFEHVRGHTGHPENEECDRLAVAAAKRAGNASR